jgi:DNA-binding response OmpR family regulator
MAKQQILLVDADTSSARLLEVSLRSAGFTVATAGSAESALSKLEHGAVDLILTDTRLPGADGFAFVRQLRARPELGEVPVVFLTEQGALDDKLRGLELGVDDYLAKPIMVREVVTRVQLLLARKKQQRIAAEPLARTRFSGSLEDVAVVDLMQTITVSGKSGVASVKRGEREAWLYFDRGQIIDAEVGDLRGEEAVYRAITWTTGFFDLEFRAVERARVIDLPNQALLMEGLRRVDELGRLAEQLPPEDAIVDIDHEALASRLNEIPDELNGILRLIDGKRTLVDLIDASPFDDLSTLTVLSKFYFEGLLLSTNPEPVEWAPGSRPGPAMRLESSSPAEEGRDHELPAATVAPAVPSPQPPAVAVPVTGEPQRESQRLMPAPSTIRPPLPDNPGKVTPKGIVNVGDATPPPPRSMPSPFRVANDAPRRSPIPLPAGSPPRSNGATGNAHGGSHTNGVRESRTMYGLSAAPMHQPPATTERSPMNPRPPSSRSSSDAEASSPRAEQPRANEAPGAAPKRPVERALLDTPTHPAPAAAVPAPAPPQPGPRSSSGETPSSIPGSNPESEQEFFEAGDEGTYAGGPRSGVPVPHFEVDAIEAVGAPPPSLKAARHPRTARGAKMVAGVLLVAAIPLMMAVWRHFAAQQEAEVPSEVSTVASEPYAMDPVKQPGNTDGLVAPAPGSVSPVSDSVTALADAGARSAIDGAAPMAEGATPAPSPQPEALPATVPRAEPQQTVVAAKAAAPALTRTRPTARKSIAPGAEPSGNLETPFIPPFKATLPNAVPAPKGAAPRAGEKPPTAAYPLH